MSDTTDSPDALRARALRLLARREHSRAELERKLAAHAASAEVLGALLDALAVRRQLSDARYAEERAQQLARKFGAARIRRALVSKGIAADVAERLAAETHGGELERARAILERRYRAPAASRAERARRMRFLQSRGFDHDTIRRLLSSDAQD